jgi:geranylgeranyl diphosphate synthase type II
MIAVSAELGCLAAGVLPSDSRMKAARSYAQDIGLAFQIVDDVLDVIADVEALGKPIGSDAQNKKTTFLTYYSTQEALQLAAQITARAKKALDGIEGAEVLLALADYLVDRRN